MVITLSIAWAGLGSVLGAGFSDLLPLAVALVLLIHLGVRRRPMRTAFSRDTASFGRRWPGKLLIAVILLAIPSAMVFSALGTDRYPPFTLAEEPDYPATLDIAYPEKMSRGLVLVKWWLLALPHYFVVAVFVGGAGWTFMAADSSNRHAATAASGGLIGLLVAIAGITLLFTDRYPRGLHDLIMGLNRWVLRVTAYAALMTDVYPPFRLEQGGTEPVWPTGPEPSAPNQIAPKPGIVIPPTPLPA